ncbi:MAG: ABC transporter ATP-binding protein [Spirochaetes bacterium]|nr:ABC transporter ATP-binding protein [Spirochaetota bacterium]
MYGMGHGGGGGMGKGGMGRGNDGPPVKIKSTTYFRILGYSKPYLPLIAVVLVFIIMSSFLSVLPSQVMGVAVDKLFTPAASPIKHAAAGPDAAAYAKTIPITPYIDRLAAWLSTGVMKQASPALLIPTAIALLFIALFAVGKVFGIIQQFIMIRVGQSLINDMRNQVYGHLQKLSPKYYDDRRTGDITSRVIGDVNSLEQVIVGPVVDLVRDMFNLLFVLSFCLMWDVKLTLLGLLATPVLVFVTRVYGGGMRKHFRELRQKIGDLSSLLQDNLSGMRMVQAFTREQHEMKRFDAKNRENYTERVKLGKLFAVFRAVVDSLNQAGTIAVLFFGSIQVARGLISPGIFIVFFRYLPRLYEPINGLSRFYNFIQQALASSERVFEVLDTEPLIKDAPHAVPLTHVRGEVEFRDVSFSYDSNREVLSGISLTVHAGAMTAFVGPSGSGKTTLTNLIPRFYDPTKGAVLVEDRDIREYTLQSLRSSIGIVQQDPFLFNDTVRANIAYGKMDASEDALIKAAEAANARSFIEKLPEGYNTVIGERGIKLSGGQKQRIAIARAILADPRILIFDEATSSVDTETEALIRDAIDNLVKDRTTLVIAHRLSTVQHASRIIVLDQGRIIETGTHEELLAMNGLYTRLYEIQFRTSGEQPEREREVPPAPIVLPDIGAIAPEEV